MTITIIIRLIKSFEYRNIKTIPIHIEDDNTTFGHLCQLLQDKLDNSPELARYKSTSGYDSYNLHYRKFGAKSSDPVINHQNPVYALKEHECISLKNLEITDECEISFFNLNEYENYKNNPQRKW